ncbi:MAG: hypothetical protein Q7T05_05095 [Dehalococcoidia bacterium]|nr:hypothetical protein [Dehalococcoidia bacterium]
MSKETLQDQIQSLLRLRGNPADLICKLKEADSDTLYALISQTGSTGTTGAEYEAVRETTTAILHARLTDNLVATMKQLNKSATILYWVGMIVAAFIGIAQILVPLLVKY